MKLKEFIFSKKYGSLYYRLSYFLYSKIPFISKGWNEYHNPLYHWWKVRKYFKFPKVSFYFRKNYTYLKIKKFYNSILCIQFSALGWKNKYNQPRFMWNPFIKIILFKKYNLLWIFYWEKDYIYNSMVWEYIIKLIYYDTTIENIKKYNSRIFLYIHNNFK